MTDQKFTVVPTKLLFAGLPHAEIALYCLMSSWGQGGRGRVWPSQQKLAMALNVSERHLKRLIASLQSRGLISRVRTMKVNGQFGRNEYELLGFDVDFLATDEPGDADVPWQPGDTDVIDQGTPVSETRGHPCPIVINTKDQYQKNKTRRFAPPAAEEVKQVFIEKGAEDYSAGRQAEAFVNYYTSVDWVVGRKKMVNWKAAAAGWFNRGVERGDFKMRLQKRKQGGLFE